VIINHFIFKNSGPMVKNLFLKHGVNEGEGFKPSHLCPKLAG